MTTEQSTQLCRVLSDTIWQAMIDPGTSFETKAELQCALHRIKVSMGVIDPVICHPYMPTAEEERRMVENGET